MSSPTSSSSSSRKYVTTNTTKFTDRPRYFGNVTLEMIDDFLKPLDGKPSQAKVKYLPVSVHECGNKKKKEFHRLKYVYLSKPTATGGAGFIVREEEDELDPYYVPFSMRKRDNNNDDYSCQFNEDIIDSLTDDFDSSTVIEENDNGKSIVGSRMSQIESITTFDKGSLYNKTAAQRMVAMNEAGGVLTGVAANSSTPSLLQLDNTHIYSQYKMNTVKYDESMPIFKCRKDILQLIQAYTVCIVQGGTGCGKTTQVPQYIFDEQMRDNKYCNIIVTQPRRIAAVSVAQRVCNERSWDLGTVCGYQIGLDRKHMSPDTRICYVTTGKSNFLVFSTFAHPFSLSRLN
jgi:hypothetical protein